MILTPFEQKQQNPWFVYLIHTAVDTYYCGITNSLTRRFLEHNSNSSKCAKYLRKKQPLELVWFFPSSSRSQATQVEAQIKKLTRVNKVKLINSKELLYSLLSKKIDSNFVNIDIKYTTTLCVDNFSISINIDILTTSITPDLLGNYQLSIDYEFNIINEIYK